MLLGEILTVAFLGFATGVIGIQSIFLIDAVFLRRTPYTAFSLLDWQSGLLLPRFTSIVTTLLALLATVLVSIPGFFLVSRKVLSVKPIDVFRTVA